MAKVWILCISVAEWAEDAFALCIRIARRPSAADSRQKFSSTDGASGEEATHEKCPPADWAAATIRRVELGEKVVVENVPLEKVADFCWRHNYRWRFDSLTSQSPLRPRFIIEQSPASAHHDPAQSK